MKLSKRLCIALSALVLAGCTVQNTVSVDCVPEETEKLVIYTPHPQQIHLPLIQEFEERTGIWVDIVYGGTNKLLERIDAEQESPVADVLFGGGAEHMEYYKDLFAPYVCQEHDILHEEFYSAEHLWTPFSAIPVVLVYNTKLVNPEQLQSWEDLKNPVFEGEIAFADPSVSGSYLTALINRLLIDGGDPAQALAEYAEDLQYRQFSGSGEALAAVVDGRCLVGITLESTAVKLISAGADIAMIYPSDGTSFIADGTAILKNAPHSENTKRFLDFTVSYDVQQLLVENFYRRSVSNDLTSDESLLPLSQIPLVNYNVGWAVEYRPQILDYWADLLRAEGRNET